MIILAVAASLAWYNDHLAPVGSVDGQNITKDEYRARLAIESWRMDETERRIRTAVQLGHLTDTEGQTQQQILDQQRSQVASVTLERLIDQKLQAKLAVEEGVTATPADIDAKLAYEATTPESRHAWVIEVKPLSDIGSIGRRTPRRRPRRRRRSRRPKDIEGGRELGRRGQDRLDGARQRTQGRRHRPPAGRRPLVGRAVSQGHLRGPAQHADRGHRGGRPDLPIGLVTEINAATVDPDYQSKIVDDKIDMTQYRAVVAADVIKDKLQDKITAQYTDAGPQRHVEEIYIKDDQSSTTLGDDRDQGPAHPVRTEGRSEQRLVAPRR